MSHAVELLRKGVRALFRVDARLRSSARLLVARCSYAGFHAAPNVRIGRGVHISVAFGTMELGENCTIGNNAHLKVDGGRLVIGPNSFIGDGTVIVAGSSIQIGADALIAEQVTIRDQDHGFAAQGIAYREQPMVTEPVVIGRNVWLGAHVTVTRGARIGDDAIVGANSVVTGHLPEATVSVGSPARVKRSLAQPSPSRGAEDP